MQFAFASSRRRRALMRHQLGIGLIEIIIVLGLIGALIAVILRIQADATASARTQDTIRGVTQMAGAISNTFGRANSFDGVSNASVLNGHLVEGPFRMIGGPPPTGIRDAHNIEPTFAGSGVHFGISFTEPDIAACTEIATTLFSGAVRMHILAGATAAALPPAAVQAFSGGTNPTGGTVVKVNAAAAMDPAAITAACSAVGDSRTITVIFR